MTEDTPMVASDIPDIVNGLAVSPAFAADGICFAARNSGLYRSDDGGQSWQSAFGSLTLAEPLAATAVAVSPAFAEDATLFVGTNGAVMRSVDGGQSWTAAALATPEPFVTALAVSPNFAVDGLVLAGTMEDGVFRSADRGATWEGWNFGLLDPQVLCLAISPAFAADETIFAGTATGVFRSGNGGRSWREIGFDTELAPVLSIALAPRYPDVGTLAVGTEEHGLYLSHDRGQSWVRVGEQAVPDAVNGVVLGGDFPAEPELLALLDDALLVSRDGGATWADWRPGLDLDAGAASIAAPRGLDPQAPLLVGLIDGGVLGL